MENGEWRVENVDRCVGAMTLVAATALPLMTAIAPVVVAQDRPLVE